MEETDHIVRELELRVASLTFEIRGRAAVCQGMNANLLLHRETVRRLNHEIGVLKATNRALMGKIEGMEPQLPNEVVLGGESADQLRKLADREMM